MNSAGRQFESIQRSQISATVATKTDLGPGASEARASRAWPGRAEQVALVRRTSAGGSSARRIECLSSCLRPARPLDNSRRPDSRPDHGAPPDPSFIVSIRRRESAARNSRLSPVRPPASQKAARARRKHLSGAGRSELGKSARELKGGGRRRQGSADWSRLHLPPEARLLQVAGSVSMAQNMNYQTGGAQKQQQQQHRPQSSASSDTNCSPVRQAAVEQSISRLQTSGGGGGAACEINLTPTRTEAPEMIARGANCFVVDADTFADATDTSGSPPLAGDCFTLDRLNNRWMGARVPISEHQVRSLEPLPRDESRALTRRRPSCCRRAERLAQINQRRS